MSRNPQGIDPHFETLHGVLRNLPGLTSQADLDRFETAESVEATIRLKINPIKGRFDTADLKAIHARIFQNIYPWAGEFRQVNIRRSASYYFAAVQFIEASLNTTLAKLAAENHLKGLDAVAFANRAAYYLCELNAIHPFREGNGRTQREFIGHLAAEAGPCINWSRISREQMYDASIESHSLGKNDVFAALILSAMKPVRLPESLSP
jgi:cell filamentation protein